MEISLDALLGMQQHGQDLTYRLAQGVSGLLLHVQPPQLPWPAPPLPLKLISFDIKLPAVPFVGGGGVDLPAVAVASFVEIGSRLGQAGSDLGASVGGAVQQLSRQIPVPFRSVPRPPTPPVRSPRCTPRTSSVRATVPVPSPSSPPPPRASARRRSTRGHCFGRSQRSSAKTGTRRWPSTGISSCSGSSPGISCPSGEHSSSSSMSDGRTHPSNLFNKIIEGGCKRNIKMRGLEAYMSQTSANMLIRACIVKKEPALLVSIIHV
ncbi:uncharacterized protein LOC123404042 [Hordeum vulgare subsp. vulgare]|uniref:uncharacterized protein LOC123404042 n=1 Tax=Hordeum vulgare subsp. vulgare TaxID=112509 RepID=UPI001D1A41A7|nr:uncharacterized protein LOC123404042 [Hordeum vulgare subsp. vulgare]